MLNLFNPEAISDIFSEAVVHFKDGHTEPIISISYYSDSYTRVSTESGSYVRLSRVVADNELKCMRTIYDYYRVGFVDSNERCDEIGDISYISLIFKS